jgi:hypothetical protein
LSFLFCFFFSIFSFFFFFFSAGDQTQGLALARQAFFHWAKSPTPLLGILMVGSLWCPVPEFWSVRMEVRLDFCRLLWEGNKCHIQGPHTSCSMNASSYKLKHYLGLCTCIPLSLWTRSQNKNRK